MILLLLALFWSGASFGQTLLTGNFTSSSPDYSAGQTVSTGVGNVGSLGSTVTSTYFTPASGFSLGTVGLGNGANVKTGGSIAYMAIQPNATTTYNKSNTSNTSYVQLVLTAPTGKAFNKLYEQYLTLAMERSGSGPDAYAVYYQYGTTAGGAASALPDANAAGTADQNGGKNYVTNVTSTAASYTTSTIGIPAPLDNSTNVLTIQIRYYSTLNNTGGNIRFYTLSLASQASTTAAATTAIASPTPTPVVTTFDPATSTIYAGAADQTLSIGGTGFSSSSPTTTVTYGGNGITAYSKIVTVNSATSISIPLTAADIQNAGTYSIVVSNGTGFTNTYSYIVTADPAVTVTNVTQPNAGNIAQAAGKSLLQSFVLNNTSSNLSTLNTVNVHLTGTYTANDIANIKLYYSLRLVNIQ